MLPLFRNGLIHDFGEDDVIATRYTTFDHVVDVTGMSIVPGLNQHVCRVRAKNRGLCFKVMAKKEGFA